MLTTTAADTPATTLTNYGTSVLQAGIAITTANVTGVDFSQYHSLFGEITDDDRAFWSFQPIRKPAIQCPMRKNDHGGPCFLRIIK